MAPPAPAPARPETLRSYRLLLLLIAGGNAALALAHHLDGGSAAADPLWVRLGVSGLALALDERGYVRVGPEHETSIPGIHAAGDLMTHYHGALAAAAAGSAAAHCINHGLTVDLVGEGLL